MGNRISELRKQALLTQGELAARAGVSRATINNIETGRHPNSKISTLRKIADALSVQPNALFDDEGALS